MTNKKVKIEKRTIEVPVKIEVDGKSYPIHQWNVDVIREWELTEDESVLERLKSFSLDI